MLDIQFGEQKNGLLEKLPPRKLASLKFVGLENWLPLSFLGGPNVYTSFILLNSALHNSNWDYMDEF